MTTRAKLEAFLEELEQDVKAGKYTAAEARELEIEARADWVINGRDGWQFND